MNKRNFLKKSTLLGVASAIGMPSFSKILENSKHIPEDELAQDDTFWNSIRGGYKLKPDYINLENGYYNFMPTEILEKYIEHVKEINYQGSFYLRTVQFDNKKRIAAKLSELFGCKDDELIITRNTTESLDMVIAGQNWQQGDEAVMAEQDYGAMLDMFKQISKRYGTVNKIISIPNHPKSDEEIVELYSNAITSKTKLLMVCHVINITGQILPVKKICDMAKSKNVKVMVDGAHAFAHIKFNLSDINCDYYGCSLHKWLSAPLGAGMLYVRKEEIKNIWPIFAEAEKDVNDILRLNHTGTIPVHVDLGIENAINYFNTIGIDKKEARLRFLQNYWTSKVRELPNVILNTPKDKNRACAIANVGIKNIKPSELCKTLLDKYKIYTVAIDYAGVQGCRITPNIYTSTKELDLLVKAIKEMVA
ncbi:MAG: aminotransferase class V-fold PLP-dependent enzyme [Bacteroidota bacterium]|jgi:selenocysteine lyase/cysteine desulfurase